MQHQHIAYNAAARDLTRLRLMPFILCFTIVRQTDMRHGGDALAAGGRRRKTRSYLVSGMAR